MSVYQHNLNFDPCVEDPDTLKQITRRGFMGRLLGSATAGAAFLSLGSKAFGEPVPALGDIGSGAAPDDERYWELVSRQFLIRRDISYMNTGTRGPSPRSVHMAQADAMQLFNTEYPAHSTNMYFEKGPEIVEKLAAFTGADKDEIALTNNTTDGMIIGTWGPDLKPGDEILYTNHDHVGGTHPVLHRALRDDLKVGVIDLADRKFHPPESPDDIVKAFEAAITSKTKLISFCHINYTDGCVMPVKEICEMARARGIFTLVDGAQPPGMLKLDLHDLGCDMYAGPCHKWMMASMMTGFFYIRKDLQDRIQPVLTVGPAGGNSMYGMPPTEPFWETFLAGASKYAMRGSGDFSNTISIDAAIDFHNHLTSEAIEARIRYLAGRFREGLENIPGVDIYTSADPRMSGGLVAFTTNDVSTGDLNKMLWDNHKIYIRSVVHEEIDWDVNRASLHVMVTSQQVDKLLGAIEEMSKKIGI